MIYYYYYYLVNEKIGKECTLAIWTLTLLGINAGNVQVVGYYDNDIVVFVVVYLLYVFTSSNWWLTHEIRWQEVSSILQNFFIIIIIIERIYRQQSDAGIQIYEAQYTHHDTQSDKGKSYTWIPVHDMGQVLIKAVQNVAGEAQL